MEWVLAEWVLAERPTGALRSEKEEMILRDDP